MKQNSLILTRVKEVTMNKTLFEALKSSNEIQDQGKKRKTYYNHPFYMKKNNIFVMVNE